MPTTVANAERLRGQLGAGGFTGVVVLTGPRNGNPDEECAAARAASTCGIWCASPASCPKSPGESPRLYVVTRNAQTVLADDVANLEQGGLRGLLRVIGAEHPHLRATQIDVDEHTDAEQVARQLLGGSDEDETAWRNGEWYTARLCPSSAAPRGAANHRRRPRARRHAPADPHAR